MKFNLNGDQIYIFFKSLYFRFKPELSSRLIFARDGLESNFKRLTLTKFNLREDRIYVISKSSCFQFQKFIQHSLTDINLFLFARLMFKSIVSNVINGHAPDFA